AQSTDLDPASRVQTVKALKSQLIAQAPEVPLIHLDRLEAYRSDRWKNVIQQPTDTGTAFFSASSPTFLSVEVAPQLGSDKLSATVALLVILGAVAVAAVLLILYFVVRTRGSLSGKTPEPPPANAAVTGAGTP